MSWCPDFEFGHITSPRDGQVMVWIHGGAFQWGRIAEFDGAQLAASANAVVVMVQYRLGPLGFFQSSEIARENLQVCVMVRPCGRMADFPPLPM